MVQELSDADSSATGSQRAGKQFREQISGKAGATKLPEHSNSCMTGSNPSSDTCQDGKQAKTTGVSKANRPKLPRPSGPPPQCPRCSADPSNTKFCYYNNYNINQPRYYCKACQRHWTDGGTLRKVETGAGKRNSRRARGSGSISTSEAGAPVHSKYARVSREVPHQHWAHENFMHHRVQSMPMVPGAAPSYFDTTMQDHNSSDANISFQEGSSFNPDKMMLDEDIDTAQAMADLDVIFANDRLDAILGSAQPIPTEDASLGTMLGLEVLEDLAQAYPSDTDFQQAIDGMPAPADSSRLLHGSRGTSSSGKRSISQTEMIPQSEGPQTAPSCETHKLMPSPTVRSPAPTPPPPGVNVGAAFRNHGRPVTEEPTPAPAVSPSNVAAADAQNPPEQNSEATGKAMQPCIPSSYNSEPPWDTQHASATTTRAPSEEATLATIVDQSGALQSLPSGGSWPEVQMAGAASGTFYTERPTGATWSNPGAPHVVPGQHGVPVAPAGSKYPAASGASVSSGMMAVPLGMRGNGQAYAVPAGGFQQFVQPGRAQRVQGGYYMPTQPMPGVRFQHASRVQQPQARQMAPGSYYIMQCDPQHQGGMPGMPSAAPQAQQSVQSPTMQQQQQQKSPRTSGGSVQLVSTSMDGSPSIHSASGHSTPQEQARPSQLYAVEHGQHGQVMLTHPQMYAPAVDKPAVNTAGAQQVMPAGRLHAAPALVPVTAARSHSHMFMSPQSDSTGGVASGAQGPSDQNTPRLQCTANARAVAGGGVTSNLMQGTASACSSNPSAASSQSNAVYVDFRQGAVMPGAAQQPASPAAGAARQGQQLRGPVFCVAQPQWQHAGRPVYTLQQLQHHAAGVQLQHHAAPVCYVQGGYMQQGRQHAVCPPGTRHPSPRDSTAGQGSDEPEQEQQVLDGAQ